MKAESPIWSSFNQEPILLFPRWIILFLNTFLALNVVLPTTWWLWLMVHFQDLISPHHHVQFLVGQTRPLRARPRILVPNSLLPPPIGIRHLPHTYYHFIESLYYLLGPIAARNRPLRNPGDASLQLRGWVFFLILKKILWLR